MGRSLLEGVRDQVDAARLEDARLLLSELLTNAVRHAGLGVADEIVVKMCVDEDGLLVEVTDPGRGFQPAGRAEGAPLHRGWGLHLLERLSDDWGVERARGGGSRVWFRMPAQAS